MEGDTSSIVQKEIPSKSDHKEFARRNNGMQGDMLKESHKPSPSLSTVGSETGSHHVVYPKWSGSVPETQPVVNPASEGRKEFVSGEPDLLSGFASPSVIQTVKGTGSVKDLYLPPATPDLSNMLLGVMSLDSVSTQGPKQSVSGSTVSKGKGKGRTRLGHAGGHHKGQKVENLGNENYCSPGMYVYMHVHMYQLQVFKKCYLLELIFFDFFNNNKKKQQQTIF